MDSKLWQDAKAILDQALDLDAGQRQQFLDQTCGGDQLLRREVESLLDLAEGLGDFITEPLFTVRAESPERLAPGSRGSRLDGAAPGSRPDGEGSKRAPPNEPMNQ